MALAAAGEPTSARIRFDPAGEHIEAPALFDGKASRAVIIDTGSDMVAITTKLARALGYHPATSPRVAVSTSSGGARVPLIRLKSLRVGNAELRDVQAVVMDFAGRGRVSAVVGMSFLSSFTLEVDASAGTLSLSAK